MKIYIFILSLCLISCNCIAARESNCTRVGDESISNESIEEINNISYEHHGYKGSVYNEYTTCKIKDKEIYFLILSLRPSLFAEPSFINTDEYINSESYLDKGFYASSIVSLKKSEYEFLEKKFTEYSSHPRKDFAIEVDGAMWCFKSKTMEESCFDLSKDAAKEKLRELLSIYNFIRTKFPKTLEKQEEINQLINSK